MFRSKTLFVVGAGASCEVGLPSGENLKGEIARRLTIKFPDGYTQQGGDRQITEALRKYVQTVEDSRDINPYLHACWRIAAAMPQAISIDNFIEAHQHDQKVELCGKLGIVKSIIEAEKRSKLYFDQYEGEKFNVNLGSAWHTSFLKRLTEGVPFGSVGSLLNNVSIITFNYDRCIEHFLLHGLINYYGLPEEEVRRLINFNLTILHPYGQVGRLPWQLEGSSGTAFGGGRDGADLLAVARQIKTFTERVEEEKTLITIKNAVAEADVIVFLGFAFADQNMDLLKPDKPTKAKRVFATAYEMSKSDTRDVETEIGKLLGRPSVRTSTASEWSGLGIEVRNDLTCAGLFNEYSRSMSR